jgi:hypothetical protein
MHAKETKKWTTMLPGIVRGYNGTVHSTLMKNMRPKDVTYANEKEVYAHRYGQVGENSTFKFALGENVRVAQTVRLFYKGYRPQFSDSVYHIVKQIPGDPPVYRIAEIGNDRLSRVYTINKS